MSKKTIDQADLDERNARELEERATLAGLIADPEEQRRSLALLDKVREGWLEYDGIEGGVLTGTMTRKQAAELVRVLGMHLADDDDEFPVRLEIRRERNLFTGEEKPGMAARFLLGRSLFGSDLTITDAAIGIKEG